MGIVSFINQLTDKQKEDFLSLDSPFLIQTYLDSLPYVGEELNRSPLRVMQDRQCHCLDGGMLAAAALYRLGYPPLLVDLVPEPGTDDDHVLAVYRQDGLYGSVAKSNFSGLRLREPVYRTYRELVMSYFEDFYNLDGLKTIRGYTRPLNLKRFDRDDWLCSQAGTDKVVNRLYAMASIPVLSPASAAKLTVVDQRSYQAGMLGVNYDGLYKPGSPH